MKRFLLLLIFSIVAYLTHGQRVSLAFESTSVQQKYAAKILQKALEAKGYAIDPAGDWAIVFSIDPKLSKEAFGIIVERKRIYIRGGGNNGLIYGALSMSEDLRNGISIDNTANKSESAGLPFRGIKFDLPWDTYRHSYSLDQHQETCADVKYWEAFLDMMAENRFNTLTLWNLHPYTFMIRPKNFPEASPWNETEMKKWKELFSSIIRMAKERGIDTYLVPFNIFVTPEFSKAQNVAMDNLEHHFFVRGDTSEIVKRYTRECVTQVLQEYPDLTGFGLTLGEGMGGMTPQQRENWMKATIIAGMKDAGRPSKLIHRIPFSSTTGSLGPTSIETEKLTRAGIEQEAAMDFIEDPVWADLKFNWSHPYGTPKLIKVHGGKLFGAYFDPIPKTYKIIWTARNEDFFCLRWGVPSFVRSHIQTNSPAYAGGYLIGSETYIPAKDYFTKPEVKSTWKYAFERQWLFYKMWGRLMYNSATSDKVFQSEFVAKYGKAGEPLLEASSLAGSTLLRLTSSFDIGWDFTLYGEGFMALNTKIKRVEYISVDRQIEQPPLDPDYVSITEYVEATKAGRLFDSNRITPLMVAEILTKDCNKALGLVKNINTGGNTALQQEVADIKVWANLGLFFSEKIKGAVALQTFRVSGGKENQHSSVSHLQNALKYWDEIIVITKPLYNEMPLVHLSEQDGKSWQENNSLRFHWSLLRPDVARDIEIARKSLSK